MSVNLRDEVHALTVKLSTNMKANIKNSRRLRLMGKMSMIFSQEICRVLSWYRLRCFIFHSQWWITVCKNLIRIDIYLHISAKTIILYNNFSSDCLIFHSNEIIVPLVCWKYVSTKLAAWCHLYYKISQHLTYSCF